MAKSTIDMVGAMLGIPPDAKKASPCKHAGEHIRIYRTLLGDDEKTAPLVLDRCQDCGTNLIDLINKPGQPEEKKPRVSRAKYFRARRMASKDRERRQGAALRFYYREHLRKAQSDARREGGVVERAACGCDGCSEVRRLGVAKAAFMGRAKA